MFQLFYLFWPMFFLMNWIQEIPKKISTNYLSFVHSVGATSLSYYLISNDFNIQPNWIRIDSELIFHYSMSYFIWDSLQILYNTGWKKEWAYLLHHSICLIMLGKLYLGENVEEIVNILFVGEASNFFNYVVYHMIKKKIKYSTVIKIKVIQMMWFVYFRIYWFSLIVYEYYFLFEDRIIPNILMIVYFMGYVWGAGQMKSLYLDGNQLLRTKDGKKDRDRITELKTELKTSKKSNNHHLS